MRILHKGSQVGSMTAKADVLQTALAAWMPRRFIRFSLLSLCMRLERTNDDENSQFKSNIKLSGLRNLLIDY